jgi:glucose-1-phosphatase
MRIRFLYFDLGNVLLHFDHEIACRQIAELTSLDAERVRQIVFQDLQWQYERGQISSEQFYQQFCERSATQPAFEQLQAAASEIFALNVPVAGLAAQLHSAGHRLGLLSNTCEAHWQYVFDGRYRVLRDVFDVRILSFELGTMKPDALIYREAAKRAKAEPGEIFFVDDRRENVQGALRAGFDAVLYRSPTQLVRDLRARGVPFNY